jgi:hypothetical protein
MDNYETRIREIKQELSEQTLGEAMAKRKTSNFGYVGVGYGYNLKGRYPQNMAEAMADIATPDLDEVENLARSLG